MHTYIRFIYQPFFAFEKTFSSDYTSVILAFDITTVLQSFFHLCPCKEYVDMLFSLEVSSHELVMQKYLFDIDPTW
jgi:hypothetical protein